MRLGIAIAIAAVALSPPAFAQPAASQQPKARTIYISAVEPKGGAHVDHEPFPDKPLPPGGGYALKGPDDKGRWEVSAYRWDPGTIVVNQGDSVTLEIVGINGDEHPFTIEGYWISGVVRRGQVTRVKFTADKAGIFKIICRKHSPAMQGDLVVLERR
jgi:hypothetical protein